MNLDYFNQLGGRALNDMATIAQTAGGASDPTAGIDPSALNSLPPELVAELSGNGASPTVGASSAPTLQDILSSTAAEMGGRGDQGGAAPAGPLPAWYNPMIRSLPADQRAAARQQIDPYLGVAGDETDNRVYFGSVDKQTKDKTKVIPNIDDGVTAVVQVPGKTVHRDDTLTITQAMNAPYTWDQDKINETIKKMTAAGLNVSDFNSMVSAWGSMVDRASKMYSLSAGQKKVTPWDVLDMYKTEALASGSLTANGDQVHTQVTRSVNELTEGQSWSVLRSTLQGMLGRDPSDQELRDYVYRMNTLAARNPSITKSTTRVHDGNATTASHSSGGFTADDATQSAYDQAQNNPDYAEFQSATTYYNALQSALGAIGG